ncbi:MAG TPA: hypothetical protein VJZ71_14010 [Phycisphaerae bacterium]|nr:hypothetical protein [Phycisphaerae bacterium]
MKHARYGRWIAGFLILGPYLTPTALAQTPTEKKSDRRSPAKPQKNYKIILPPEFDKTFRLTPVVFALHGHGGNAEWMESVWKEACADVGAILVVGQGFTSLGDNRFAWAGAEDAGAMIEAAKKELTKKYKLHRFAPRVLTGMSQGGWATYELAQKYPKSYRRLIPVAGMLHWKTQLAAQDFTADQKNGMKRWRIYIMAGVKDANEIVADNRRVASQLKEIGAAVLAPFTDKRDPSWSLYQDLGHAFPGQGRTQTKELTRALRFILQPDDEDRRNWAKVDPGWERKAKWLEDKSPPSK